MGSLVVRLVEAACGQSAGVLVCNPRKIPLLGQVRRRKKQKFIRGLNRDYNHDGMMGSPLGQGEQKTKTRPL